LNNGCAVQGSDTTMLHAVHLPATKKRVDEDFEVKIREVTKAINKQQDDAKNLHYVL
jgi:hypothetical protein